MGVDCKFLNFGVHIAIALKLHGLKVNFPLTMEEIFSLGSDKLFFCVYLIICKRCIDC
jgi:hypothetical protein